MSTIERDRNDLSSPNHPPSQTEQTDAPFESILANVTQQKHVERNTLVKRLAARDLLILRSRLKMQRKEKMFIEKIQILERNVMEREDDLSALREQAVFLNSVTERRLNSVLLQHSPKLTFEMMKRRRATTGRDLKKYLPHVEKLELVTPQSNYLDERVLKSPFAEPLQSIRQDMHNFAQQWKVASDTSLNDLCYIFEDIHGRVNGKLGRLSDPSGDWNREMRSFLKQTKIQIQSLMRRVDSGISSLVSREKPLIQAWTKSHLTFREIGCTVDLPPPEDPRISRLREKVADLEEELKVARASHAQELQIEKAHRSQAEKAVQTYQQSIFLLHDACFNAMHACFRHRYRSWTKRCPDNFWGLDRELSATPEGLQQKYADEIQKCVNGDLKLLKQFTDFFLSTDFTPIHSQPSASLSFFGAADNRSSKTAKGLTTKLRSSTSLSSPKKASTQNHSAGHPANIAVGSAVVLSCDNYNGVPIVQTTTVERRAEKKEAIQEIHSAAVKPFKLLSDFAKFMTQSHTPSSSHDNEDVGRLSRSVPLSKPHTKGSGPHSSSICSKLLPIV